MGGADSGRTRADRRTTGAGHRHAQRDGVGDRPGSSRRGARTGRSRRPSISAPARSNGISRGCTGSSVCARAPSWLRRWGGRRRALDGRSRPLGRRHGPRAEIRGFPRLIAESGVPSVRRDELLPLVERYVPGLSEAELRIALERVEDACAELSAAGMAIRYLGSILLPVEEACFCRFDSDLPETITRSERHLLASVRTHHGRARDRRGRDRPSGGRGHRWSSDAGSREECSPPQQGGAPCPSDSLHSPRPLHSQLRLPSASPEEPAGLPRYQPSPSRSTASRASRFRAARRPARSASRPRSPARRRRALTRGRPSGSSA